MHDQGTASFLRCPRANWLVTAGPGVWDGRSGLVLLMLKAAGRTSTPRLATICEPSGLSFPRKLVKLSFLIYPTSLHPFIMGQLLALDKSGSRI